ncbi:hypothetical protein FKW77_007922 [Venturia effusa]|uniref:Uncharacterized protein n=1 Tax=Venturia effusa TaxID=50376 RepID=A0A517LHN0_9PEZI|nr:hypothetical protein FKW77_007922 [Venturia effusa]
MFLLFGRSEDSLEMKSSNGDADTKFANDFNIAQDYLARRGRLGGLYWLIGGSEFRRACKSVHDFLDEIIRKSLASDGPGQSSQEKSKYIFLDALIEETKDPTVLRSQLLNVLLAGRDTTACTLSWAFILLSRNPSILRKLRMEIASVVGNGSPTQADLKKMHYLSLVIKEVLRLYPSVPVNSRMALRTTTLPIEGGPSGTSPVMVRKGEAVGYCVYAMHRRRDIYGEDADEFRIVFGHNNSFKGDEAL